MNKKKSVNMDDAPLFSLFWENSKFNRFTDPALTEKLSEDARTIGYRPQLLFPGCDHALKCPEDELMQIMKGRKSGRRFSDKPLSFEDLGALFSSFKAVGEDRRILPSAGGKYPIEVFAFFFNTDTEFDKKIVYYNADFHSLTIVGTCPSWDEILEECGLLVEGIPAALFIFVGFAERVISKYGERGGRFLLIEAGHYAQNLSLRIAALGMSGVEAGGLHDDRLKRYLCLNGTGALIALGFACGYP